jgi:hypothetical protein
MWSTSYHHVTVLVHRSWPHLLFTVVSVLRRHCAKPSHNLSFTLATDPSSQASSWSSPPWSHDSMPCLMSNRLLHDIITCGLIFCVSRINTISPPKVVTQLPKPNKDLSQCFSLTTNQRTVLSATIIQRNEQGASLLQPRGHIRWGSWYLVKRHIATYIGDVVIRWPNIPSIRGINQ